MNPFVVTPAAADQRATEIGTGLVASATLGAGQFCTKPGLAFIPDTPGGDSVLDVISASLPTVDAQVLLTEGIRQAFERGAATLQGAEGVSTIAGKQLSQTTGFAAAARVIVVDAHDLTEPLLTECFGPIVIVVRYRDQDELLRTVAQLPGSLAATIHGGSGPDPVRDLMAAQLCERTGRVLFDGYPTGVAVSWAQNHGGPWPATDTQFTSVGAASIRRFLRPLAWQSAPAHLLPTELRDLPDPGLPRRVDGHLQLPN